MWQRAFANPDEDNLVSQIRAMLMSKSDFDPKCENGVVVEPDADWVGLFDFGDAQRIIDSGYVATMRQMDQIKLNVARRTNRKSWPSGVPLLWRKEPRIVF